MRRVILVVAALLLLCTAASAQEEDPLARYGAYALEEGVPDSARDLMDGATLADADLGGAAGILTAALAEGDGMFRTALASCASLLVIALLSGLVTQFGFADRTSAIVCALGISAVSVAGLQSLIGFGERMIAESADFLSLLLPVLATTATASGAPSSAGLLYTGTSFFYSVLMRLMQHLLLPMLYAMIALSTAEAAFGHVLLGKLTGFFKWLAGAALKAIMLLYSAYMAASSIITGSADAAAVKTAKAAISGVVPVVGSMIADASETVLLSASLVKSTVGTFGMLAVLAICISPFLRVGIQYLLLKAATALGGTLAQPAVVRHMETISSAVGLLLAMVCACSLMLLMGIVCFIKVSGV